MERIQKRIRQEFSMSELARIARNNYLSSETGPRGGARYDCNICKFPYTDKQIDVDHIDPVIPIGVLGKDMDANWYIERTFCDISNLQVLCKVCHKVKSDDENRRRVVVRKLKGIKEQLPDGVSEEHILSLWEMLPEGLRKLKAKEIGALVCIGIRWYKKFNKKGN